MDRLWTPWRYSYVTGLADSGGERSRKGVPQALAAWTGEDAKCVFCNLIRSVTWAAEDGMPAADAERAGYILARLKTCFVCLNAFPYASGHLMVVPYRHVDSLAALDSREANEVMASAQHMERVLRSVYAPDGINLGMNLGQAAGAGVVGHIHLHILPRWVGDTNFMTVTAETRVLPEMLEQTFARLREAIAAVGEDGSGDESNQVGTEDVPPPAAGK